MPSPADYSALAWTNAFLAAHAKFSREYAFTEWKSIDWGTMYSNTLPLIVQAQAETNAPGVLCGPACLCGQYPRWARPIKRHELYRAQRLAEAVAGGGYGLALAELDDGRIIAAAILTNMAAQIAGIEPGAEIESWNGMAVTSALAQIVVRDYPLKALATTMEIDPQATLDHERLEQLRLLVRGPIARMRKSDSRIRTTLSGNRGAHARPIPTPPPAAEFRVASGFGGRSGGL
jgi:carboxyl-terminal processing protease